MCLVQEEEKGWNKYLKDGERCFLKRNKTIYMEGTKGNGDIYYIKSGKVKVSTTSFSGRGRTLEIVNSGMIFGEQAVDGQPYFSTAVVLEDAVIYCFPNRVTTSLIKIDTGFRSLMYGSLREKLELLVNNIVLQSLPAEQLLAYYLLEISSKYNNKTIPLSQQEISQYTGLTRVTIYNVFKKWGSDVIRTQNKKITLHNDQWLKKILSF